MSAESPSQLQDHSESSTLALQCPLSDSCIFLKALKSSGLLFLEEIEKHVSTSQCRHPPLKDLILPVSLNYNNHRDDYSTPLLIACYVGDLDCVKHIVENWRVDFKATAEVHYFISPYSCKEIGLVTPLFVATQKRDFAIVQYLVAKGADVIDEGTKLLQVLLNYPSYYPEIRAKVRAIALLLLESGADPNAIDGYPVWMGMFCGTVITTALVHHGLKLDQRTYDGDTILHYRLNWRSFQNPSKHDREVDLIKLLVNNGADLMARGSGNGFTPIFLAATKGIWKVLDFMLEREEVVRKEKIDALEMAAATILSSNDWDSERERAFGYLRQALLLRQMEMDPLHMTPLKLKRGRTIGWITSAQLDQVIEEPAEYKLQSYLIQLRILSDFDRNYYVTRDLEKFLLGCIDNLKKQNRFDDLVDVLWATFEKIQLHLDSPREYGLWSLAYQVVENLIWVLSQLGRDDPLYSADTFRYILKLLLVTDRVHSQYCTNECNCCVPELPSYMDILFQLITFLTGLPEEIMNDKIKEESSVKELLYRLVLQDRLTGRTRWGKTFLHMACDDEDLDLATIQFLLQFNADPNARDEDGNGPLHILAAQYGLCLRYGDGQELLIHRAADAARLLMEYGAHLDMVNNDKKTAADIWKEKYKSQDLPIWLLEPGMVPKLKCLSARIVSSNNVPYTAETLIEILHPFVKLH